MAKVLTVLMASLLLVGTVSIGASAFTAATVERSANVDVVADNEGLLALTDGNSGNLVSQDGSTEQLGIDLESGTAAGANPNATFELGNPAARPHPTRSRSKIRTTNNTRSTSSILVRPQTARIT